MRSLSSLGVTVDDQGGAADLIGTPAPDILSFDPAIRSASGLGGDDLIVAFAASDTNLDGGAGNDRIASGAGDDDGLFGQAGDDLLSGGPGDDVNILGGPGLDILLGGSGDDVLEGGDGDDVLYGGFGADDLRGGIGRDFLSGGLGPDRFIFAPGDALLGFADEITGFEDGLDVIVFEGFGSFFELDDQTVTELTAPSPADLPIAGFFSFITSGVGVVVERDAKDARLFLDADGDGDLSAADFVLDFVGGATIMFDDPDFPGVTVTPSNPLITTLTVTTIKDDGDDATVTGDFNAEIADGDGLSLREAVELANAASGPQRIEFDPSLNGSTVVLKQGELTVTDKVIVDGDVDGDDVADIVITGDALGDDLTTTVSGFTVTDAVGNTNTADNSRVIGTVGSVELDIRSLVITGGYADGPLVEDQRGAGIYARAASGSDATISDSILAGNRAASGGGGVAALGPNLTIERSLIEGNDAGLEGGGVLNSGGVLTIDATDFIANQSADRGGALSHDLNNGVITNSTFDANQAKYGGGVYLDDVATITGGAIQNNVATQDGGGIFNSVSGTLDVAGVTISSNDATTGKGGGVYNRGDTTVTGASTFGSNTAGTDGGGAFNAGLGTLRLVDSFFATNDAASYGGGVLNEGVLTISQSEFQGNTAGVSGGAIGNSGGSAVLTAVNTILYDNTATTLSGGGLYNSGGQATLVNAQLVGNTAAVAGGGFWTDSNADLINSTVTGNKAVSDGGGIFVDTLGVFTVDVGNSIVAGNDAAMFADVFDGAANVTWLGDNLVEQGGPPTPNVTFGASPASIFDDATKTYPNGVTGGALAPNGGFIIPFIDTVAILNGGLAQNSGDGAVPVALDENALGVDLNNDGGTATVFATVNDLLFDVRGAGFDRTIDGQIDLGAFEEQTAAAVVPPIVTTATDEDLGGVDIAAATADGTGLSLREAIRLAQDGDTITFDPTIFNADFNPSIPGDDTAVIRLLGGGAGATLNVNLANATDTLIIDGDVNNDGTPDIIISGDANGDDATLGSIAFGDSVFTGVITDTENNTATADNAAQTFELMQGDLTLEGVVLTGGDTGGDGGGIEVRPGAVLTVNDSLIAGNEADGGGGIENLGTATLTNVAISNNFANTGGGGIRNDDGGAGGATLRLINSTLNDNRTNSEGGAISNIGGSSATLINTTLTDNASILQGGGFYNNVGDAVLVNVSIIGNSSSFFEGAGVYSRMGTVTLVNSTVTGNYSYANLGALDGAGVSTGAGGSIDLANSIILGNADKNGPRDAGALDVLNVLSTSIVGAELLATSDTLGTGTPLYSGNVVLTAQNVFDTVVNATAPLALGGNSAPFDQGELADNGGAVATVAIKAGGPAQNAGDGAAALNLVEADLGVDLNNDSDTLDTITQIDQLAFDARGAGFPRVFDGTVDLGAFEEQTAAATPFADTVGDDGVQTDAAGQISTITAQFDAFGETFNGADLADTLDTGAQDDVVVFFTTLGGSEFTIADGVAATDTFQNFENFANTGINTTVDADELSLTLTGGAINVNGVALAGVENIQGGGSGNTIQGDDAANRLADGAGTDTIRGGKGDDVIAPDLDGTTDTLFDGELGVDTLDLSAAPATTDLTVDLVAATFSDSALAFNFGGQPIANFENVIGGAGDDTLTGDANANVLEGGDGEDDLTGGGGADTFTYDLASESPLGDIDDITDFTLGDGDKIDVSAFGPFTGSARVDTPGLFTNAATPGFFAGDVVVIEESGGDSRLFLDANGDDNLDANDLVIEFTGTGLGLDGSAAYDGVTIGVGVIQTDLDDGGSTLFGAGAGNDTLKVQGNSSADTGETFDAKGGTDTVDTSLLAAGVDIVSFDLASGAYAIVDAGVTRSDTNTLVNFEVVNGGPGGTDTLSGDFDIDLAAGTNSAGLSTPGFEFALGGPSANMLTAATGFTSALQGGGGADTLTGQVGTFVVFDYLAFSDSTFAAPDEVFNFEPGALGFDIIDLADITNLTVTDGAFDTDPSGLAQLVLTDAVTDTGGDGFIVIRDDLGGGDFTLFVDDPVGGTPGQVDGADLVVIFRAAQPEFSDITFASAPLFMGTAGADTFDVNAEIANATFDGGTFDALGDVDTVDLSTISVGATFDLSMVSNTIAGETANFFNFENVIGSLFADTLTGDASDNVITDGGGADTIDADGGDDTVVLSADAVTDTQLFGGAGIDTLDLSKATGDIDLDLSQQGSAGLVLGIGGKDGGLGNGAGTAIQGFENVIGSDFDDNLTGDTGNNRLSPGLGGDVVDGAGGDDTLVWEGVDGAIDTYDGGAGAFDVLSIETAAGVTLDFSSGFFGADADSIANIEQIFGTSFDDDLVAAPFVRLFGQGGGDTLTGAGANDFINGGPGDDVIDGGPGANDNLFGGDDDDTITDGSGLNDAIDGGAGDDVIILRADGQVEASITGGAGIDTLDISASTSNDTLDFSAGSLTSTDIGNELPGEITLIEKAILGAGNDTFLGDASDNTVTDGAGVDDIDLGGGDDTLMATTDTTPGETYVGGPGVDTLDLSSGTTALSLLLWEQGAVTIVLLSGEFGAIGKGGPGGDITGFENVIGGAGDDTLQGDGSANRITGGPGQDDINLAADGSPNPDAAADVVVFTAATDSQAATGLDVIEAFASGTDAIDVAAFGLAGPAGVTTPGGFLPGTAPVPGFFGVNSAIIQQFGGDSRILVDVNGNGNFDPVADLLFDVVNVLVAPGDLIF